MNWLIEKLKGPSGGYIVFGGLLLFPFICFMLLVTNKLMELGALNQSGASEALNFFCSLYLGFFAKVDSPPWGDQPALLILPPFVFVILWLMIRFIGSFISESSDKSRRIQTVIMMIGVFIWMFMGMAFYGTRLT